VSSKFATAFAGLWLFASPAFANHSLTEHVSTAASGGNGNFDASFGAQSEDGTRIFFTTREPLVPADTNTISDVYERAGGVTKLISPIVPGGDLLSGIAVVGASADGSRVFIQSVDRLTPDDTDSIRDVYQIYQGTTTRLSTGPAGGNADIFATYAGASKDGTHAFITTSESLVTQDTNSVTDLYERSGSTTTLVTPGTTNTVTFNAASEDGTRVLFTTNSKLVPQDTDNAPDIYEASGGTITLISTGPGPGGNGEYTGGFLAASPDASRVVFSSADQLVPADTDFYIDLYERVGGTTTLLSSGASGGNGQFNATFAKASADATHVVFSTSEALTPDDQDTLQDPYEHSGSGTTLLAPSPNGPLGAGAGGVGISGEGSTAFFTTTEKLLPEDTDNQADLYQRAAGTTTLVSTGPAGGNGASGAVYVGASEDAKRVFFSTSEQLTADDTDSGTDMFERFEGNTTRVSTGPNGGNSGQALFVTSPPSPISDDGTRVIGYTSESLTPDDTDTRPDVYQFSVNDAYARPKGATPMRASLIPAYRACTAPDDTHGAPLAFGSCNPPVPASSNLTVGTPDANGAGANSIGSARYDAVVGNPGPPEDSDLAVRLSLTDVRNAGDLSDYTGEVQFLDTHRITDRSNGSNPSDPATVQDVQFTATAQCVATGSSTIGGACSLNTTYNALVPGAILDGKRMIIESGEVEVLDGGADGDADTVPNDLFARQGVFVP
jgi:hypothetical protein